jgi:hypothetical protein
MTAVAVGGAGAARSRPRASALFGRVLRMEMRHTPFVWVVPLIALLFVLDPLRTVAGYPPVWTVRASALANKFWPVCVPFAAGFAAWAGSLEGRRKIADLLGTTARPAWLRQLCSLFAIVAWMLGTFLAGAVALYVRTALDATWGGPPIWPVVVGAVSLAAVCAVAFTLGALFPGRFSAPIVAVGITLLSLVVFHRAVDEGGASIYSLSVLGLVPPNDAGVFYPVAPDVSIVQTMFYGGVALAATGLLGLSPRTGGVGWRGPLDVASGGGARLRIVATTVLALGIAATVAGVGLAATARVSAAGGVVIPALHDSASDKPIAYTPVCAGAAGEVRVCVHPAYESYLSQVVASIGPVATELSGLPGTPVAADEVPAQALPSLATQDAGVGRVVGDPPVYEFAMSYALTYVQDAVQFRDSFRDDVVHAVIVGPAGSTNAAGAFQPDTGTPAQQAVVDGLLRAVGSAPDPVCVPDPALPACARQGMVTAAATRFAALPAATRHAWLIANLAALRAGHVTLAQVP